MRMLTKDEARQLVLSHIQNEEVPLSTQEIINSGKVARLKGYMVRPGKVSDSIFGGPGSFEMKKEDWDAYKDLVSDIGYHITYFTVVEKGQEVDKVRISFENPALKTSDGVPLRIMVRTSRISTHDKSRGEIPFKDQVLAANHNFMRRLLTPVIGTSQIDIPGMPDNSIVIVAEDLQQISFENVLRAYMAETSTSTSLYMHYINGDRTYCGHALPDNLVPNGILPYVMDTPSTKSDEHDESVEPGFLFDHNICTPGQYKQIRNSSIFGFGMISNFLREKGIIAVDTKTEHGINHLGQIVSQDEIWTMDSSRFWLLSDYDEQLKALANGEIDTLKPKSYSKEFARGFSQGDDGYTFDQRVGIAVRYIEGIQHLLGNPFEPDMRSRNDQVVYGLKLAVAAEVSG